MTCTKKVDTKREKEMGKKKGDIECLKILEEYLMDVNATKNAFEKRKGLGKGTIYYWLRKFAIEDKKEGAMKEEEGPGEAGRRDQASEIERLKLQNKVLEKKLEKAEMARDAYDYMINLAEQRYHIKVRKNSGAK
jgi:hypothetical protein